MTDIRKLMLDQLYPTHHLIVADIRKILSVISDIKYVMADI